MAKFTEKAIMKTFLDILEEKSLDKITVKDIIEEIEINRNTFYYHFEDIYDLIDKIFKEEVKKFMSETKEGASFLEEYTRTAKIILEHRKAIVHIYNSKSRQIIEDYINEVTKVFVYRFVKEAAKNYDISEEGIEFISFFYSSAVIAATMNWIEQGLPEYRESILVLLATSFDSTIDDMIKNYIKNEKKL